MAGWRREYERGVERRRWESETYGDIIPKPLPATEALEEFLPADPLPPSAFNYTSLEEGPRKEEGSEKDGLKDFGERDRVPAEEPEGLRE